jgi:hypothetical protein
MGRFIRALMNGGALDGARILPQARLDEMMPPNSATPAGYLGLVFFGTKVAGHDSIGHAGGMIHFSSDLTIFPEQGIGIFVSRDGIGEINAPKELKDALKELNEIPDPTTVIAERFLPKVPETADAHATTFSSDASVAGIYHTSRRAESSWERLSDDLLSQLVVKNDSAGNVRLFPATVPFLEYDMLKRVERNLYEGRIFGRMAFMDDVGSESYFAAPAIRLQRVPWSLDVRWIGPAFVMSAAVALMTLLAWPVGALWRRWRKRRWSHDSGDRRKFLAVRLVLFIDVVVIIAAAVLLSMRFIDPRILDDALDPLLVVLYSLAWLGVFGAILTVWAATLFWRKGVGSRWSRIYHSLIAASSVMIAWFFVTFHIAGTTLNY